MAYCSPECQKVHWKALHKKICKQRKELIALLEGRENYNAASARSYVSSIPEDRIPAILAVESSPAESDERSQVFQFMEDTVDLKIADIVKAAKEFRKQLNREGVDRNRPGDVYMPSGTFTLLMDFKCEDQPPAPSKLLDWGPSGGVGFGYAGIQDMRENRNLASVVKKIDPKEHFVVIAQTRRVGGKTLFLVGCYDGGRAYITPSGDLVKINVKK